ncbi:hypothetical protein ELE36_03245 [Pseudolysobacter antarcticus]|uniref:Integrase n=1 Tax=Pseudolysobacter antarcticus TaxID=2511995 RepID=A0A411HG65_9GAMM|nr:hypothetical protein [Pseudolysobacter antarcticus]QBB69469.1 hypothetical protein ELE36_03245 [Pseudolysobacter antarcticus]
MATIIARRLKDGSLSYRATIRIMLSNKMLHNETRSFRSKESAIRWSNERESDIRENRISERSLDPVSAQQEHEHVKAKHADLIDSPNDHTQSSSEILLLQRFRALPTRRQQALLDILEQD